MNELATPRNAVWDDDPAGYDRLRQRGGWINVRRRLYLQTWLQALATSEPVLEIGSGTGWMSRELATRFPARSWVGLEPLAKYTDYARAQVAGTDLQQRVEFVTGLAEAADQLLGPTQFGAIYSNDVLHHIDDWDAALAAVGNVAAPAAQWCAIEPNVWNPYACLNQMRRPHERNFLPWKFLAAARRHGWRLKLQDYLFLIPPALPRPPEWLKRWERRLERIPFLGGGVALILERPASR